MTSTRHDDARPWRRGDSLGRHPGVIGTLVEFRLPERRHSRLGALWCHPIALVISGQFQHPKSTLETDAHARCVAVAAPAAL